jgi:carbamoyltransferase
MKNIMAANWGHDATVCFWNDVAKTFHTIEIEKLTGIKHYRGHARKDEELDILRRCVKIAEEEFGIPNDYHCILIGSMQTEEKYNVMKARQNFGDMGGLLMLLEEDNVRKVFNTKHIDVCYRHHEHHAWNGYVPSGFDDAVILTLDGGGDDGFSHVWTMKDGKMKSLLPISNSRFYGKDYNEVCLWNMPNIMKKTDCPLDVAGKAMGASSYGRVNSHGHTIGKKLFHGDNHDAWSYHCWWRNVFLSMYRKTNVEGTMGKEKIVEMLSDDDSPELYNPYTLFIPDAKWQHECDIALGLQEEFCRVVTRWFRNTLLQFNINLDDYGRNVVFSGGCALNVLFNDKLQKSDWFKNGMNLYVPPNPADQGIPYGMLCHYMHDNGIEYSREATTYSGQKIQDMDDLQKYCHSHKGKMTTVADVASILKDDKIIGFIQGGMEVGARALGNRSILADPKGIDKKDKVNEVKRREAYRPFAPVCRLEDAETYFDSIRYDNLSYMNFAIKTREEHIDKLRAVTHVDGTARVQTVTREQNEILYDLLTEFDGVLLNTSFNVKGSPILNTLKEAFYMLDETTLDHLVVVDEHNTIWIF